MLGTMLEAFEAQALLNDTLVVLVGDHGEAFGEHGVFVHNSTVHEEEVVVPLVFWSADGRLRHSGVVEGRQIDVAPTILDLFGLTDDATLVQGDSLLRAAGRAVYLSTFFDDLALGLVEAGLKYVYEPATDEIRAYDLTADPDEARPRVVHGEQKRDIVRRLRAFQAYQRETFWK
jgi:arylsulfatase A-like enzyme